MMRIVRIVRAKNPKALPRRRSARQTARRKAEREVRRSAVRFARWVRRSGVSQQAAADSLGLSVSTLGRWMRSWRKEHLTARPRGRPLLGAEGETRRVILAWMTLMGPQVSLAVLRDEFPRIGRAELVDLQRRMRRLWRKGHVEIIQALEWTL